MTNPYSGELYGPGDVMTILFSIIMSTFALGQAAPCLQAFAEGLAAGKDLFSLVDSDDGDSFIEKQDQSSDVFENLQVKEIKIQNVSFRYPSRPEVQVLNDVSLTIREGEKVAFVGESGSGKSSLIALLERFYDPQSG